MAQNRQLERKHISKLQADPTNLKTQEALAMARENISIYGQNVAYLQTADRTLGQVFAASGYTLSSPETCRLDWGLVEVYPNRVGGNEVSLAVSK